MRSMVTPIEHMRLAGIAVASPLRGAAALTANLSNGDGAND
jgi:hypothetical protein